MAQDALQVGQRISGFLVEEISSLEELNATLYQLRHEVTCARLAHLATDDDNNLFGVAFHTTPADSTGVAHILEHTVLCGSQHYPVRDPFFSMIKRSLNTFMNALTSSDWTLYPFSSQNEKDFYNLMGVYLDAAFFPRLRESDFRQEGHRLEVCAPGQPDSPLEYKGVVYNEMKGAMADPSSLLSRRMNRALYPTTTYGHNSGGEPEDIPSLTHQQLQDFHADYYHPANAYFFTYGNLPLQKHLETIEEQALSRFEPKEIDSSVPDEVRYDAPLQLTETYPIDPGQPLDARSMVQMAWLTCPASDSGKRLALQVLSVLLLGNPAAPLYKALLESKLGQNLSSGSGYHDDNRETLFAAGLQGTEPERMEQIEQLIITTLEECAKQGFEAERIEAALHQMEFSHREVSGDQYPYALLLLMRLIGPWIHSGDPVTPLRLIRDLDRLREQVKEGNFFGDLIREQLLDNPHRVTLLLRPDAGQKEREEEKTKRSLAEIEGKLTGEQKQQLVRQAEELQAAQEAEEDLSCLPTLELEDIPARERQVSFRQVQEEGADTFWFAQPTNGITYFSAQVDACGVPEELRGYLPLFCALLPQVGAAGLSYLEMAQRISAVTGGIRANAIILEDPQALDQPRMVVEIRGKALLRNQEKMFAILTDIFSAVDFSDLERLHTVIGQLKISLENSIPASGHSYAARHAASRLSAGGRLREDFSGITQLRLIRDLASRQPKELTDFSASMQRLSSMLLTRASLRCAVTAEQKTFAAIEPPLRKFLAALPTGQPLPSPAPAAFSPAPAALGLGTSVPVSYVARVFRTVAYTHDDAGAILVLAKLLRAGFLHREIREKGGAYGGMASYDLEAGIFSMLSYRDPQLTRTLQVYRQAAEWAEAGSFSDEEIKEAILSVFSDLDRPLSPGGRGNQEFGNQQQGLTPELRQQMRERILQTDRDQLRQVARRYLLQGWECSAVAVISSEETLDRANEELGENALSSTRI